MAKSPELLDLPEVLETERLILRAPRAGDGPAVNAAILETWDELHAWMPWAAERPDVDETEGYMRRHHASFIARTSLPMLMLDRSSHAVVGSTGIPRLDWSVPRFEIGYWVRRRCVGQGLVSEAVQALTAFAFATLGAARVEIRCSARNRRSQRVAERCGYAFEGRLRNIGLDPGGVLRDDLVYARIRDEAPASAAV